MEEAEDHILEIRSAGYLISPFNNLQNVQPMPQQIPSGRIVL